MMSDIRMEKVMEAIYEHISDHVPADGCKSCGLLRMLSDLMANMKRSNNREIALEMGFEGVDIDYPFLNTKGL